MSRRPAAVAFLAFLVALAGCDPAPSPAKTDTPVRGGTLTVSVRGIDSLDPAHASEQGALAVVSQLFDSLTEIDPTTNEVAGASAKSWSVSADGLVWRFHLRDRIYADGRPVVAADFAFAFDRIARKATHSQAAFQLENILGFAAVHTDGTQSHLAGVSAPAPRLLQLRLLRPFAELPYALAHPALAPIPAARYKARRYDFPRAPIGNGPYALARALSPTGAMLVRNRRYKGRIPNIDTITFRITPVIEDGWRDFLAGSTDVAGIPSTAIEDPRARFGLGGLTPVWATLSFGLNLARPAFRDPVVRRAISLAIDRETIARTVYAGTRDPATGIIARGVRGFRASACGSCRFDPARARATFRAAFGSKPPVLHIDFLRETLSTAVATAIASTLAAVGLPVLLRAHSRSEYLKVLEHKQHDIAELGWLADTPSPDGFLAQQLLTGSLNNQTGFSDAAFDAAIARARATTAELPRLAAYRVAESRALAQMPLIPIVFFRNRTAIATRVHNLILDGAGLFDPSRAWLAPA